MHMPEKSFKYLLQIYNIWITKNVPHLLEKATVIPISQNQNDSANPTNYQPIVLASCICKTFEKMVNTRLTWHLETKTYY